MLASDSRPHICFRPAGVEDVDALVAIENASFDADRISRRSFRRFLMSDRDILIVATTSDGLAGYILVLLRRGTRLGRIYSLCVSDRFRGRGLATDLLKESEAVALARGCAYLRLEVRESNAQAISLYVKNGYRKFGVFDDYYEDHASALRFEKRIRHFDSEHAAIAIPYYPQSTRFSCGPACLMMAMHALDPTVAVSPQHELRLWRESTTIFMTSGHGGCGPHGMALAALSRGFGVTLWLNRSDVLFTDGLRNPEKQAVVALVQHDFEDQLAALGIVSQEGELSIDALGVLLSSRQIPVMLISSWSLAREKAPHWIVVAGVDDEFVYIHDPDADGDDTENTLDRQYIPIDHLTFKRMTRFGKVGLRAAVVLRKDA